MRLILWLISFIVPRSARPRWREEWIAELQHGGWRMLTGAVPDAWAMRKTSSWWLPPLGGRKSSPFHALDQDVRYAVRGFSRGKSFSLAVIGSLAIGIGATTAAFAIVNATFFRPFPEIHAEEELVRATIGWGRRGAWLHTTWDDYEVLRKGIVAVEDLSISHLTTFAVTPHAGGEPRRVGGRVVSANYFNVLGVRPAVGRFFTPDEDAAPWAQPAVVVSDSYWRRHLDGDPAAVRRTLNVNGTDLPIIGVGPEGFDYGNAPEVWITFALSDLVFRNADGRPVQARHAAAFGNSFIGRLKPGATIEQARAQAAGLASALQRRDRGVQQSVVRVDPFRVDEPEVIGLRALALMIIPIIVLTIACVNAANLLLARATTQSADWLTRLALGATRWRLIRQVLVESVLLALAGATLGLLVAFWSTGFVQNMTFSDVAIDGTVMLFALIAAVATALVFGLAPALSVTRTAVARAPEAGRFLRGPFGSRTRSALVVVQAALCLGLLATSALFTRALHELWDDGLPEPSQFLTASLNLDLLRYTPQQAEAFYVDLLRRVQELPAVSAAALTDRSVPDVLGARIGSSWGVEVSLPGQPERVRGVMPTFATADFFETMGLDFVEGRTFMRDEHRRPPRVVVVNQDFVKRAFGENPLGRVVTLTTVGEKGERTSVDAMVVGVIANPPGRPIFSQVPNVFFPAPAGPRPALDLAVRFEGDANGVASAIRTIVSGIEPRLPLDPVRTGEELRRLRNSRQYTLAQVVSLLGILSLALAAAGLYGVVSYMVTLRQKEIGIRMALGAATGSVLRLVLRQSIVPVLAGCVLGAIGAAIIAKVTRAQLYGVSPLDPFAFGGATLVLLVVMIMASLAPARRASRVDPVVVLRRE